ncbi:J domain-containing protein [Desulfonatronum thioautotrophicum]|uniref:J domain-containing protein n=1 Tax=Desulfonatronum thioautotrophicum TaxID=617001 RepID=UPI0012946657|nr:J domain-containing protein [Desulfonatronum thioautotrophicum]
MFKRCTRTLRVSPDATMEDVRQAFVKLARRWPPEHFPARFTEIKHCTDVLNLDDSVLEELLNRTLRSDVIDVFVGLLPDTASSPEDVTTNASELDIPAFMELLNPGRRREIMLECLEQISDGTVFYRR